MTIKTIVTDRAAWDDVLIWHTHPMGQPSPSNVDWDQRIDGRKNLVVALPSGQFTLY